MGYRLKSTTHYSLHAQSLEKLSCINLYHYPNYLLVKRQPPLFRVWLDTPNMQSRPEFLTNTVSTREDEPQFSLPGNRTTCSPPPTPTNAHTRFPQSIARYDKVIFYNLHLFFPPLHYCSG